MKWVYVLWILCASVIVLSMFGGVFFSVVGNAYLADWMFFPFATAVVTGVLSIAGVLIHHVLTND